jgi:hypothetical protein
MILEPNLKDLDTVVGARNDAVRIFRFVVGLARCVSPAFEEMLMDAYGRFVV